MLKYLVMALVLVRTCAVAVAVHAKSLWLNCREVVQHLAYYTCCVYTHTHTHTHSAGRVVL